MRLIRLGLVGDYKSITGIDENPFYYQFEQSSVDYSPICLVGLNGSGKSNFIELITDIFGYADRFYNEQYECAEDLTYDFEVVYTISIHGVERTVILVSKNSKLRMFYSERNMSDVPTLIGSRSNLFKESLALSCVLIEITENCYEMLPANIISYSSGHNQGLSSVFARSELQFFEVIRKQGVFYREYNLRYGKVMEASKAENDEVWQSLSTYVKNTLKNNAGIFSIPRAFQYDDSNYLDFPYEPLETFSARLPKGLFTDHSLNNVFFVYLMACRGGNQQKYEKFRAFLYHHVNISDLCSFDIHLRLTEYKDFEMVGNIVRRLTELSYESQGLALPDVSEELSYSPKLHFKYGDKFLTALERLYLDETVFLDHLLTLHHLTAKRWSFDEKRTLRSSKYHRNVPNLSGGLMPMRIMNVAITLGSDGIKTIYDRLSDGEHQLIQVVASLLLYDHQQTLFILDEPESHFNPEWRIEFMEVIKKYVDLSHLELIISTHSPFMLSACDSDRVLHFKKNADSNVSITPLEVQSYGASFDSLLTSVFDLDVLISKRPLTEIRAGLRAYDEGLMEENETLEWLKKFGDSFELNLRRNQILRKIIPIKRERGTD